jgi:4-diphosphocytidyl-2-C-methyl-D-erythritol kinase
MKRIALRAFAKINWVLDVIGKRNDGYHDVEMVMQSVGLYDTIIIKEKGHGIRLKCNECSIPPDNANTAYRAAALVKERFNIEKGIEITLNKGIPVAAGMAGGSADAAAVLVGLCRMWDLNVSTKDLMDMGGRIGSDVPFCVVGGTALARGRGDEITVLPPVEGVWLVLVTPDYHVSTAEVYRSLDLTKLTVRSDIESMIAFLHSKDLKGIAGCMINVLEGVTIKLCPEIDQVKEYIMAQGAVGCCMSGSGPTVYGLFPDERAAQKACAVLKQRYSRCFVAQTKPLGIQIVEEVF